jgi:hypothetical protein
MYINRIGIELPVESSKLLWKIGHGSAQVPRAEFVHGQLLSPIIFRVVRGFTRVAQVLVVQLL